MYNNDNASAIIARKNVNDDWVSSTNNCNIKLCALRVSMYDMKTNNAVIISVWALCIAINDERSIFMRGKEYTEYAMHKIIATVTSIISGVVLKGVSGETYPAIKLYTKAMIVVAKKEINANFIGAQSSHVDSFDCAFGFMFSVPFFCVCCF